MLLRALNYSFGKSKTEDEMHCSTVVVIGNVMVSPVKSTLHTIVIIQHKNLIMCIYQTLLNCLYFKYLKKPGSICEVSR